MSAPLALPTQPGRAARAARSARATAAWFHRHAGVITFGLIVACKLGLDVRVVDWAARKIGAPVSLTACCSSHFTTTTPDERQASR